MRFSIRTATIAAVTLGVASSLGFTAPGSAFELDINPVEADNAVTRAKVPTPPVPILPPELTPEKSLPDDGATVASNDDSASADDFASLSQAVAAQVKTADMDAELKCLAVGVYFESKGEPLSGQLAVADVILNRARSGRFPQSVCSVLKQRHQFSFVRGGRLPRVRTHSRTWKTALAVAKVARQDLWDSPVPDALFFHARYVKPHWRLAKVGTVGNHVFYR